MKDRRRTFAGRDQKASPFGAVLMRLCDAVGGVGAALVDAEGETVDYAGTLDPFGIKIAAAEISVLLDVLRGCPAFEWNRTEELFLRGGRRSFYARVLGEGYAIVVVLMPLAFTVSRRAVVEAIHDLSAEAGLRVPPSVAAQERWFAVEVQCHADHPRRPQAIWLSGGWFRVEVLGVYGAEKGNLGFRARLDSGAELTLVRERLGRWYADAVPPQ
jgi:hypothetical protein